MSEREEDNRRRERETHTHPRGETKEIDAYGKRQAEGKGENRDSCVCCGEKDVSSADMCLQHTMDVCSSSLMLVSEQLLQGEPVSSGKERITEKGNES